MVLIRNYSEVQAVVFDFDGVMTDNMVYIDDKGHETVRCCRADGIGIQKLLKSGVKVAVISQEKNIVVRHRCKKLGIECMQGIMNKDEALGKLLTNWKITLSRTAYVGNDVNDLVCLKRVKYPIIVKDAHPLMLWESTAKGFDITNNLGGHGAVREVCDRIYDNKKVL